MTVKLCESFSNIVFGTSRDVVRKTINCDYKEFKKSKYSKNTTDDYGKFHVYYDEQNLLSAVEVFNGEEVLLDGKDLFKLSLNELKQLFPDAEVDTCGFISRKSSIGVFAQDNQIETILIGRKDYYN
ncbi:MAG: hypothetical protein MR739_04200 [Spirochaetia bacterium]|nr:hypothetical protein [Spirochaetia bacterium]